jgi:hypothetical protein
MQVNPRDETYGEIVPLADEEGYIEQVREAHEKGGAVVVADSSAVLRKLQDDLRRAGYKKLK